jgi:hypothetical protein
MDDVKSGAQQAALLFSGRTDCYQGKAVGWRCYSTLGRRCPAEQLEQHGAHELSDQLSSKDVLDLSRG